MTPTEYIPRYERPRVRKPSTGLLGAICTRYDDAGAVDVHWDDGTITHERMQWLQPIPPEEWEVQT